MHLFKVCTFVYLALVTMAQHLKFINMKTLKIIIPPRQTEKGLDIWLFTLMMSNKLWNK